LSPLRFLANSKMTYRDGLPPRLHLPSRITRKFQPATPPLLPAQASCSNLRFDSEQWRLGCAAAGAARDSAPGLPRWPRCRPQGLLIAALHDPDAWGTFRHPRVPPETREDYRDGFRRGYHLAYSHFRDDRDHRESLLASRLPSSVSESWEALPCRKETRLLPAWKCTIGGKAKTVRSKSGPFGVLKSSAEFRRAHRSCGAPYRPSRRGRCQQEQAGRFWVAEVDPEMSFT